MAELARAHLVTEYAPGRYAFHDLLRAYAMEQGHRLDTKSDRDATNRRILDHYLHTANTAALLMYPHRHPVTLSPAHPGVTLEPLTDREQAREWLESEHQVLLAAVSQAATTGLASHSWQLAWALADFLDWRGHWHDLVTAQRVALDAATRGADQCGQAHARRNLARAYIRLSRFADAQTHLDHAIALSQQIGDQLTEAESHLTVSLVLERLGRAWPALAHSQRALELYRITGHRTGQARSLNAVGWYHTQLGDHERALACCQEAVALYLLSGNRTNLPAVLDTLGVAHHNLGNYREATEAYRQAIGLYRESGDRYNEADTLTHLGEAYRVAGTPALALAAWRQALVILEDLQHPAANQLHSRLAAMSPAVVSD
jgi:tetratricopeptide (TPR) repeat protein